MIIRNRKPKGRSIIRTKKGKKMTTKKRMVDKFGGCLPSPPTNCDKKEFFFSGKDGTVWIDLSICHKCENIKGCETRKQYLEELGKKKTKVNEIKSWT